MNNININSNDNTSNLVTIVKGKQNTQTNKHAQPNGGLLTASKGDAGLCMPSAQQLKPVADSGRNISQVPIDDSNIKIWGAPSSWSNEQWQLLEDKAKHELSGEAFMKLLGYKRRKDLEQLFYRLSSRCNKLYRIRWDSDVENGKHSLPELKTGKTGLHISTTRFKRYGLTVPQNTYFVMSKIADDEIRLKIVKG